MLGKNRVPTCKNLLHVLKEKIISDEVTGPKEYNNGDGILMKKVKL
jgi:hypothetical protein